MKQVDIFQVLILIARPAAGKSEVIDYLKRTQPEERKQRFHVGMLDEIDDFPLLWTWFEEDALLEKMGKARLHTDAEGYFLGNHLWDLLIERISLEYQKRQRQPEREAVTTLIEFSRGSEHGGYRSAFAHLSQQVLEEAALLYIDVPWEESLRKNRMRFNPDKPDSILEHSLPDAKLERLYRETDWGQVSAGDEKFLHIGDYRVPYVVFDNSDDITTARGPELGKRLESCLGRLWDIYFRK
jgi:hypothetical protein